MRRYGSYGHNGHYGRYRHYVHYGRYGHYGTLRELRTLQELRTVWTLTDITDVAGVTDVTDITGGTVRHMAFQVGRRKYLHEHVYTFGYESLCMYRKYTLIVRFNSQEKFCYSLRQRYKTQQLIQFQ